MAPGAYVGRSDASSGSALPICAQTHSVAVRRNARDDARRRMTEAVLVMAIFNLSYEMRRAFVGSVNVIVGGV